MNKVPFNDLSRIHEPIHKKVFAQFSKVVQENRFVLNKEIGEFECLFSEFTESKYTVSCASGTDALELILRALEIGLTIKTISLKGDSFSVDVAEDYKRAKSQMSKDRFFKFYK